MIARARFWSLLILVVLIAGPAGAKTKWVSVQNIEGAGNICLEISGQRFDYAVLDRGEEARCTVNGPRRLKLISRYLFAGGDSDQMPYTVIVAVDDREVLRKSFTGRPHADAAPCDGNSRVASLRRSYVDLGAGAHRLSVRIDHEGEGQVALRLFREVKRQRQNWVTFAPESYSSVRHLQFGSGNQSTYYHFESGTPLRLELAGPTTLRVGTRLDFDHTMNGSQTYAVEVVIDGETWRTLHFDATKLTTSVYLERPDILPGSRKEFRITVPRGLHVVEIRCVRPETCGVAAMIHIPKSDLER